LKLFCKSISVALDKKWGELVKGYKKAPFGGGGNGLRRRDTEGGSRNLNNGGEGVKDGAWESQVKLMKTSRVSAGESGFRLTTNIRKKKNLRGMRGGTQSSNEMGGK